MIFGAHCSTAGGVHRALERAEFIGASACQIFVKNNMQWAGRKYDAEALVQFEKRRAISPCRVLFGHTGYLINVAAPISANRDRSIDSLVLEIELADQLGLPFLVLHPGAHLGSGEKGGLRQAVRGLDEVCGATRKLGVRIALENTAGQGTCLGHAWWHLDTIFQQAQCPERLGLCIDTAHCFAAGQDLRTPTGWESVISEIDSTIGLDQVLAIHLNDSKTDLGSRVDRHAAIGEGRIGRSAFAHIVNDARFANHPGCLETPKSPDLHEDIQNLAVLNSLMQQGKTRKAKGRALAAGR